MSWWAAREGRRLLAIRPLPARVRDRGVAHVLSVAGDAILVALLNELDRTVARVELPGSGEETE